MDSNAGPGREPRDSSRAALITGASAGLGLAIATALAARGTSVTLAARDGDRLKQARLEILNMYPRASVDTGVVDLREIESVRRFCEETFGLRCPDILVHNTGGPPPHTPGAESTEVFLEYLHSHTVSHTEMLRTFAPRMQSRGWGRVIAVMSRTVAQPRADNPLSAAVRLPAWAMMKSYALSGRYPDVTFNAILPGIFATERFESMCRTLAGREGVELPRIRERFISEVPAGRLGRPTEVGALCAFLASDDAGYVSGQKLVIDGGSTAVL